MITRFSECAWIQAHKNVDILGPTGIGKTWLACAFSTTACKKGYKTKFLELQNLREDLEQAVDNSNEKYFIKKLIKFDLIVIDDFGLSDISSKRVEKNSIGIYRHLFDTR